MKKPENHTLARSAAVELFHDDDTIPPASQEMFWKTTLNFPGETNIILICIRLVDETCLKSNYRGAETAAAHRMNARPCASAAQEVFFSFITHSS
jgi:hypothetical protein